MGNPDGFHAPFADPRRLLGGEDKTVKQRLAVPLDDTRDKDMCGFLVVFQLGIDFQGRPLVLGGAFAFAVTLVFIALEVIDFDCHRAGLGTSEAFERVLLRAVKFDFGRTRDGPLGLGLHVQTRFSFFGSLGNGLVCHGAAVTAHGKPADGYPVFHLLEAAVRGQVLLFERECEGGGGQPEDNQPSPQ